MDQRDESISAFEAPFTKEEMRKDVLVVMLNLARQLFYTFGRPNDGQAILQAQLLGWTGERAADTAGINTPDCSAENLGLVWDDVKTTFLADTLDRLYDLAFMGLIDPQTTDIDWEGGTAFSSRILHDLRHSEFIAEWTEYSPCLAAIERCLLVYETAQARLLLNGYDDTFMEWRGLQEGLSIRQLALLANMTEASVRSMTNPKRKHQLLTHSDGRNTYVKAGDAKAWLQAKGRDVPLRFVNQDDDLDLATQRFVSLDMLGVALESRIRTLVLEKGVGPMKEALSKVSGATMRLRDASDATFHLDLDALRDDNDLDVLAEALGLPARLLKLRTKETRALEALRESAAEIAAEVSAKRGSP